MENKDFNLIRDLLNNRNTVYTSIATSDKEGELNIAPIGSPYLPDADTIVLLRGPLNQTYRNLKENPSAVFMVVNNKVTNWVRFFFTGNFGTKYGYRIYARLREERAVTSEDKQLSFKRFGSMINTKGGKKVANSITSALVFDIIKIREILF